MPDSREQREKNSAEQEQLPLVQAIQDFAKADPAYFRIPAHRFARGTDPVLLELLGEKVFSADLTEAEGLDDLHAPSGVIEEAEQLAAALWGSEECHFLVNGSTCGNEAMLLACLRPGEKVLLARNVHKSVLMGLVLSGAVPVWMQPEELPGAKLEGPVSAESVRRCLDREPDCRAVMVVSPTYYGVCSPLREIAAVCHDRNIPLLVDEAHGAHLCFLEDAPEDALKSGADLAVQSIHKTGGSMTQSSLLHVQGSLVDRVRIRESLTLVMSTSPSYVLMASLDAARHQLAVNGRMLMRRARGLADRCRHELKRIPGIMVLENGSLDPLRIVFSAESLGLTGTELQKALYRQDRISLELSDPVYVVAVITWGNTEKEIERLTAAVRSVTEKRRKIQPSVKYVPDWLYEVPEVACSPREAWYADKKTCLLERACGQISAESIIPYPPGIPVLYPGERITEEILAGLVRLREAHTPLHGPVDTTLRTIRVLITDT